MPQRFRRSESTERGVTSWRPARSPVAAAGNVDDVRIVTFIAGIERSHALPHTYQKMSQRSDDDDDDDVDDDDDDVDDDYDLTKAWSVIG